MQSKAPADFNERLVESIDETITALLSKSVLDSIYLHLERYLSISKDELPYRLDTFFSILEKTFGRSERTIGKAIARRFYSKLRLEFDETANHNLRDYVEEARRKLPTSPPNS